ncbi:hypothetical protein AVEN_86700-1 [Araneus ventricosus]|uniref:Uncharacterized protein n=1 Tax=Araneus ventricosus TaxID=182803 RepID=A0A4Y2V218_ARAVE|nr:hypothetical protein AVEN_86700-1 [Araneus ventricosus]
MGGVGVEGRRPLITYLNVITFHMKQKLSKSVGWLRLADSVKNFLPNYFKYIEGRGGLVVTSRPRDRRAAGPIHDSTEDLPGMRPVARQIIRSGQTSSRWCGAEAW